MSERSFFDTSVLVYALDPVAPENRGVARALLAQKLADRTAVISTQVLQELFVSLTKKLGIPAASARTIVQSYTKGNVVQVNSELIVSAIDLHRLNALSFWDALIVRAAVAGSCVRIFTEDLSAGQLIDGVEIVNPF
jgi:predicted nucleic acid-binding protein